MDLPRPLEVTFFSFTENRGGADKAAFRMRQIVSALGVKTKAVVIRPENYCNQKSTIAPAILFRFFHLLSWVYSFLITKLMITRNHFKHSLNLFGTSFARSQIKNAQMLHIHWINNEMIKVKDFGLFSGRSVITLHDEWFYCGAEHYAIELSAPARFIDGYGRENNDTIGFDLNRYVWKKKRQSYQNLKNVIFTVPSTWMLQRAKSSLLLKHFDIRVVPNPVNTDAFKAVRTNSFYQRYKIEPNDFIIAYCLGSSKLSHPKGFDLLKKALSLFDTVQMNRSIKLVIFGKPFPVTEYPNIPCLHLGEICDYRILSEIYSAATITVVPSRAESFGQVAAESLACETPVVGFDYSGIKDIVIHKETGYLAEPFSPESLFDGIYWFYKKDRGDLLKYGRAGRAFVMENFSSAKVGKQLVSIYDEIDARRRDSAMPRRVPRRGVASGTAINK